MASSSTVEDLIYTAENKRNAERLQELYRTSGILWLDYFHKHFPRDPKALYNEFKKHKKAIKRLRSRGEITYGQQQLIFPPNSNETHSYKFDLTLVRKLISKLANLGKPEEFWFKESPISDQSREANLVRLAIERNKIQHGTGYVPNDIYNEISERIIKVLVSLGKDRSSFDNLLPPIQYGLRKVMENFFGRRVELQKIHEIIENGKQNTTRVVVAGLAGVGKSETIRKFCSEFGHEFENNILWVTSTNQETLQNSFKNIAEIQKLNIKEENGNYKSNENIINVVHHYFRSDPVLFVFDDVTDIATVTPFLPTHKPSTTILTTQCREWPQPEYRIVEINELDRNDSNLFLLESRKDDFDLTVEQISEIVTLLGGHLLAMQQFISFIKYTMLSVDEYIKLFRQQTAKILSSKIVNLDGVAISTISAIGINIERLKESENSNLSTEIISVISYLHGEKITLDILKLIFPDQSMNDLDTAIRQVNSLSLINFSQERDRKKFITVHSLIQKTLKYQHEHLDNPDRYLNKLVKTFSNEMNVDDTVYNHANFGDRWCTQYMYFVKSNVHKESVYQMCLTYGDVIFITLENRGQEVFLLNLWKNIRHIWGITSKTNCFLARSFGLNSKYDEAIQLCNNNCEDPISFGIWLQTSDYLAQCYTRKGKVDEAIEIYEKMAHTDFLGVSHKLSLMDNLAICYSLKGEFDKAIKLHKEILLKYKETLGDLHKETLLSMYNLANGYAIKGEFDKAIKLHEEVLIKRKETIGDSHIETLRSLNKLACCYIKKSEFDKAIELCGKVLTKRRQTLGDSHKDTLESSNLLGYCYYEVFRKSQKLPH